MVPSTGGRNIRPAAAFCRILPSVGPLLWSLWAAAGASPTVSADFTTSAGTALAAGHTILGRNGI